LVRVRVRINSLSLVLSVHYLHCCQFIISIIVSPLSPLLLSVHYLRCCQSIISVVVSSLFPLLSVQLVKNTLCCLINYYIKCFCHFWVSENITNLLFEGVGGHGGSGIHADLDAKHQEIVAKISNYATPHTRPFIDLSPKSSTLLVPNEEENAKRARSKSPGSRDRTVTENRNAADRGSTNRMSEALHSNRQSTGTASGNGRIETVHVSKCAVCNILWLNLTSILYAAVIL